MMLNYFFFFFLGLLNLFLGFHLMFYNFKMAHTFFDFVLDQFGEDGVYCQLVFHLVGYALSCVLINVEVKPGCRSLQLHVWSNSSAWVLDRDIYCMRWAPMPERLHDIGGRSFLRCFYLDYLLGLSTRQLCHFRKLDVLTIRFDFWLRLSIVKLNLWCRWQIWVGAIVVLCFSLFIRLLVNLITLLLRWKVLIMWQFFRSSGLKVMRMLMHHLLLWREWLFF